MFSRIGDAAIKKDLTNTLALCEILGHPQRQFRSIHVAGTNGKGSVSHMLAAVLQEAGYKTGLYTSPHLKDFRERIKVNGVMISEAEVIAFTQRMQPHIESILPSFFEITVAMAFHHFAAQEVDIAVVETGLGGRLDSTNVITPELSVITNIGWDHMHLLGDTLPKIATEKAGIIKRNIPVVVGEVLDETRSVFEAKAAVENAPLFFAQERFKIESFTQNNHSLEVKVRDSVHGSTNDYTLDLPGIYQCNNLITVLAAIEQLKAQSWRLSETVVKNALRRSRRLNGLQGRWEKIATHPDLVIDVGHNEDGIKQILLQLQQSHYRQYHIVTGMVKDKDVEKVLTLLPKDAHYYFTQAQIPRALPAGQLQAMAAAKGLNGHAYTDVNTALENAMANAEKEDLVLVCGSVFLAGEVDRSRWNRGELLL